MDKLTIGVILFLATVFCIQRFYVDGTVSIGITELPSGEFKVYKNLIWRSGRWERVDEWILPKLAAEQKYKELHFEYYVSESSK
jgi:hypothetical protein